MAQVVNELYNLHNFLFALAVFINKVGTNYNQNIQQEKRLRFKQDKNHKWVFIFFIPLYVFIQC